MLLKHLLTRVGMGMKGGLVVALACLIPDGATQAQTQPVQVVTSFSILGDMVEQVGGPQVQVRSLVGPDSDSHVFNPTPSDARALASADLVVINGLGFEGWMERLVKASGFKGPVVVATKGVEPLTEQEEAHDHKHGHSHSHGHSHGHSHSHQHDHGSQDPHAWQDLKNAKVYVTNIRDALVALRPEAREEITQRTQNYLQQLDDLDTKLQAQFAKIPKEQRRAIVSHDAFGYLAQAYDIEFLPVQGWSTGREASASDVAQLIRQVREGKVQAYFVENMSDPRILQRIADDTGAKAGGRLYSDALSAPGTEADTYLKMYTTNGQRIVDALAQ